ncbi:MAG: TonB-dependent receptor [Epsilonproteobacteria bacterium]|nr:TonB-dependent receptor [Campylobacterota bacterium]
MKRSLLLSGLVLFSSVVAAEEVNLETIQVESSTIQDLAANPKTEPSTVNVIDEKQYEIIDPKNINEALRTIPGVTADVRSGDTVEIHIRGVNQQEFMWEDTGVAVVIDGVPVLQNGGKVKINLDNIESIKVIKGGASYLYGPNAMAGAVIITTKKPKDRNDVTVSADYGSYAYQNYMVTLNRATDQYALVLNGSYRYTSGYWDMSENWTGSGNGKFTWFIDDTSDITFGAEYTKKYEESSRGSVTGFTAAEEDPTGADDGDLPWSHDYWTDIQKYFITYNKDLTDTSNLLVNTYYYADEYNYDSSPQDLDGDKNEDDWTRDNNEDIYQYGLKAEYRNVTGKLAWMLGLDVGRRELDDTSERTITYSSYSWYTHQTEWYYAGEKTESDTTEDRLGLYGESKYAVTDKLTAVFNLRYDYESYDYEESEHAFDGTAWSDTKTDRDDSFTNYSWRVGATYQLTDNHTLYAGVSTGFRNPRVQELYAGDFDDDYINNTDIDTETTINYEVGMRGKLNLLDNATRYEASVYQIDTNDIISKNQGTYYWGSNYYDNVGDARTQGFELSLNTDRSKMLAFDLAYSYMYAKYTSHNPFFVSLKGDDMEYDIDGNQLPRTPHHRFDLYTYFRLPALPEWTLIAENYAQSGYYADETNEIRVPGYGIMNVQLRYNTKISGHPLEFYVRCDNITDKQYYRTVYLFRDRDYDGDMDGEDASITVDPGRVYYVGLKYTF